MDWGRADPRQDYWQGQSCIVGRPKAVQVSQSQGNVLASETWLKAMHCSTVSLAANLPAHIQISIGNLPLN